MRAFAVEQASRDSRKRPSLGTAVAGSRSTGTALLALALTMLLLCAIPAAARALALPVEHPLVPLTSVTADMFGWDVAISGDTAVVGSPGRDSSRGAVDVYTRTGTAWTRVTTLTAQDPTAGPNDEFGYSVAILGDTLLVGAPKADITVSGSPLYDVGAAYVFTRSGQVWSQRTKISAPDGAWLDFFGYSVALSDGTAVVGAPQHGASDTGAAYVFTGAGDSWSDGEALPVTDGANNDRFGSSVAVSGATTLVGTPNPSAVRGAVYIYTLSGTTGTLAQPRLMGSNVNDMFGYAVAIDGSMAVIGAPGVSGSQGRAYVLRKNAGGLWVQDAQEVSGGDAATGDQFGSDVDVLGGEVLVGAMGADMGTGPVRTDQGAAYTFRDTGTAWLQRDKLTASDGDASDLLGRSVALSNWFACTGAPTNAAAAGHAYLFALDAVVPTTTLGLLPAPVYADWNTGPVTATLSAADDESGVAAVEYRRDGTAAWTPYSAPFTVADEGVTAWQYRSTDNAGNSETPRSFTVKIDRTAPTTTAGGIPAGWTNRPVGVSLSPADALSGMGGGAARTEYSTNGGATWSPGSAANVSGEGKINFLFRSTDAVGNTETAKSATIKIDSKAPTTKAFAATVKKGMKVKLAYQVVDAKPGCGKAVVSIKIYKGKKRMKTVAVPGRPATNVKGSVFWRCGLSRGSYTMKVYATDIAGNSQRKAGSARLTVN